MSNELILQQSIQKLFDQGSSVLFRWKNDNSWSIDYVSQNVSKILGYSAQEFIEQHITYEECIHKDFLTKVQNEVLVASTKKSDFFEHKPYKIITKDKKEKWVLDQTVIEKDSDGNITHYIGYINDITQSIELSIENELLQERTKLAVESANDGIWDWDIKNDKAYFSPLWKNMLGYTEDELSNNVNTFFDLIHPDDKQKAQNALEKHFKDRNIAYSTELRLLCKDGSYKWVLSRGKAIFDENNNPSRMLGTHTNINKTKKIQNKLNYLNKRFTSMFKNHNAIMLLIEPFSGKIIDANISAQKFYGYSHKEFITLSINDINTLPAKKLAKVKLQALNNEKNNFIFTHKKKNNQYVTIQADSSVIETQQGTVLFSIITDVTKEKENEKKLKKVFKQLQQTQKMAKIGLWEHHHISDKIEWSEEVYNIFEIDSKKVEASNEVFFNIVHPDDREEVSEAYLHSLDTKEAYEITHRLLMKDNRVKYVLEQCDTDFDADGNALISRGTVQDITEFKMLDATIRNEQKRFKTLMNNASDGILIINEDLKLIEYSNVAKTMLGYSDEEMLNLHIKDWDVYKDQDELDSIIENLTDTPVTFERVHKRKDSTTYNASITSVAMTIEGEKYIYASVRDISQIKKLQNDILYEKNFIETIIESSTAIISVIDSDGRMIKLNKYGEDFTGYTQKEISKEPFKWKCFLPQEVQKKVISIVKNAKKGEIVKSFQNAWISKNGKVRIFEWSNTLVKKEDGSMDYIASIGLDITQKEKQKAFLNLLINSQSHMLVLADGEELKYVNKAVLDFFETSTLEKLQKKYACMCDTFVKNDFSFHLGKITKNENWIDAIQKLPKQKQIVTIYSIKDKQEKMFQINIEHYNESNAYLLTFIDISDTMTKQFELEYKSYHDSLTKTFNREYLYEKYSAIIKLHKTNNQLTAIAMIDIDNFKLVNDTYGHNVGDKVLKQLVTSIQNNSRQNDILIRWGGEEFILIIPINNKSDLYKTLESLRKIIEKETMPVVKNITISIGASIYKHPESIDETIKRSDENLYVSKKSGRNLVTVL